MTRCLIAAIAVLPLIAAAPAFAQGQGQAQRGGPSPFDRPAAAPGGPPGQPPPCVQEFIKLRNVTQARGKAIEAAAKRKANPKEICGLFNAFVGAEAKVVKYAEENNVWCGIPLQALEQMKNAHIKSQSARSNVCRVAAQGPAQPRGPTLGEALGATPVPSTENVKKGGGTFNTLTGSPLAR